MILGLRCQSLGFVLTIKWQPLCEPEAFCLGLNLAYSTANGVHLFSIAVKNTHDAKQIQYQGQSVQTQSNRKVYLQAQPLLIDR